MPAVSLPFSPSASSSPRPRGPAVLRLWWRRARDRRILADLTPTQMRDTGLDPSVVRAESAKPFWQA